jgi:CheY-like chemotaxis protein
MIEELRKQFLPRFIETARRRLRRVMEQARPEAHDRATELVSELHTLAGEAALLGYTEIARLAADAESAAVRWREDRKDASLVACSRGARSVGRALDALFAQGGEAAAAARTGAEDGAARVLVVDDSVLGAGLLRDVLEHGGLRAEDAQDLAAALDLARRFAPQVVLCDLHLADCSADELIGRLRALPELERSRILLVSGLSDDELAVAARGLAVDGWVSKRHGLDHVVARVSAVLASEGRP